MSKETEEEESEKSGILLKVIEALGRDAGRGIARLDPKDMEKIGAQVGDIVQIHGKRATVAKAMPAFRDARGKELIQIDGITRSNAQVGIDEKVSVEKVAHQAATKVSLAPIGGASALQRQRDLDYVGRLLDGLPVVAGDRIRATLFGSHYQDFVVVNTNPRGVVVIQPKTVLSITETKSAAEKGAAPRGARVTYEDIGGLHKAVQKIREMVELPLKYPQVFERLGIEPPKGVLLHGPPRSGKTLLARAVANETDASFFAVSGPEVYHKFIGQSEEHLREVFNQAKKNAPSIIFLDELDAIAPKREQVVGEVEKRVVATLLAMMDGLESRGTVIVIGATNLPNLLDPALRRPGRFDREIEIGIPDQQARLEVLEIHTRGMPLGEDVELKRLSEITHGFTGADLEALCREAAMTTLRKILHRIDFELDQIPYEVLLELKVTMDDFLAALSDIEPSAIREVFIEVPNVKWEDVGGLEEVKKRLIEAVEWPLKHPQLFEHAKLKPPKGIVLHGPPGTGKTLLAKALASEIGVNFISVKGPELLSKYVGESERGVREIFRKARQANPCIIFFDEVDAVAPVRSGSSSDSHVSERVVSQLLTELDGIEELKGVWVLAATNRIDIIDPALVRPGRFDLLLELPLPDEAARLEIFKVHAQGKPLAGDVELRDLARQTEHLTGAEIEAACRRATMLAIREFLEKGDVEPEKCNSLKIKRKHFERAVEEIR